MKHLLLSLALIISSIAWAEDEPLRPSLLTHGLKCDNPSFSGGNPPRLVYIYPYGTYPFDISIFKKTDDSGWNNYYMTCVNPQNENEYFITYKGNRAKYKKPRGCDSLIDKKIILNRTSLELRFNEAYTNSTHTYDWVYGCSLVPKDEIQKSTKALQAKEKSDRKI